MGGGGTVPPRLPLWSSGSGAQPGVFLQVLPTLGQIPLGRSSESSIGHFTVKMVGSEIDTGSHLLLKVLVCPHGFKFFLCICLLHFQLLFWIHDTSPRLIIIARCYPKTSWAPTKDCVGIDHHSQWPTSCHSWCKHACWVTSVISDSFRLYGLQPTRLLCPWDSLGKNTGVGCHAHLQGIFWPQDGTHVSYISCTGRWVLIHGSSAYLVKPLVMWNTQRPVVEVDEPEWEARGQTSASQIRQRIWRSIWILLPHPQHCLKKQRIAGVSAQEIKQPAATIKARGVLGRQ